LKKSTFWFQNAENYENLSKYINSYPISESKISEHRNYKKESFNRDIDDAESHYEEEDTENKSETNKSNLVIKLKPHLSMNIHSHHRHFDKSHKNIKNTKTNNISSKASNKKLKLENSTTVHNSIKSENVSISCLFFKGILDPSNRIFTQVLKNFL